jgi:hypothetical protein
MKALCESQLLVVGLVRDCEDKMEREFQKINEAFFKAKSVSWLVIESDSNDGTLKELERLKKNYGNCDFDFITLGRLQDKYPKRTERLAKCRNRYLKEIKNNKKYNEVDFVVVADLDGVNAALTPKSAQSCWHLDVEWDACFANQSAPYYDLWALRHDLWNPADYLEQETFFNKLGVDEFYSRYINRLAKMILIPENAAPISVKSAFGGLAIYKKKWMLGGKYVGITEDGSQVCEHVHFHVSHMKNADLYIVPSFINCGWNEHSKRRRIIDIVFLFFASRFFSMEKLKQFKKI